MFTSVRDKRSVSEGPCLQVFMAEGRYLRAQVYKCPSQKVSIRGSMFTSVVGRRSVLEGPCLQVTMADGQHLMA